jgi:hypothetical protein
MSFSRRVPVHFWTVLQFVCEQNGSVANPENALRPSDPDRDDLVCSFAAWATLSVVTIIVATHPPLQAVTHLSLVYQLLRRGHRRVVSSVEKKGSLIAKTADPS